MNLLSHLEQQLLTLLRLRDSANRLSSDQINAVGLVVAGMTSEASGWTRAAVVAQLQGRVDATVERLESEARCSGTMSQLLHHLRMEGVLCMPAVVG